MRYVTMVSVQLTVQYPSSCNQRSLAQGLKFLDFKRSFILTLTQLICQRKLSKWCICQNMEKQTSRSSSLLLHKTRMEVPIPALKSSKYFLSGSKCGRVVETGPKTNGKQPVWISSALTVAPSVPTLARSSKGWERFRCSGSATSPCQCWEAARDGPREPPLCEHTLWWVTECWGRLLG